MTDSSLLPPEYTQAATILQKIFSARPLAADTQGNQQLLNNPEVAVSKGFEHRNWRPDASEDILQITLKNPALVNSEVADAVGKMAFSALNEIDAVRNEIQLTSPKEYANQVKEELSALLEEAKKAHVSGKHIDLSETDLTKWKHFDSSYSRNQIPDYGTQLIEDAKKTQIRFNIPTNPDNREEAMKTAEKVAQNLRQRLPEIKANMIKRVLEKNYANPRSANDPNWKTDWTKQMESHTFDVTTQQQGNWTGVFINISSPQQVAAQADPSASPDPNLPNSNMLAAVDEKHRTKLVARTTLFEGEGLKKPSAIFVDVAGAKDMENIVGKTMHYLVKDKPELAGRAKALMDENLFKSHETWNLPPEKQELWKQSGSANIDPDHPDTMKIKLYVPKGKAETIVKAIAGLDQKQEAALQIPAPPVAAEAPCLPCAAAKEASVEAAAASVLTALGIAPKPATWAKQAETAKQAQETSYSLGA